MRIGELSSCSGVPVSTIKYYVREGLLPAGELTSTNQAQYDDRHVHRLRLVRALIDVGGLPIATVCDVLNAVDEPRRDLLRLVQHSITAEPVANQDDAAEHETREFLMRQGWEYDEDNPAVRSLVAVLATARGLGHDHFADSLDTYADACRNIAEVDVAHVLGHAEVTDVVEGLVVDTVLGDVALRALRRLGQLEKLSSRLQQPDAQPHRRNG